jgi:hypothetical protein
MKIVLLVAFFFFLLSLSSAQAVIIQPIQPPKFVYPGEFHTYRVSVINNESVRRDVLLYFSIPSPEVICLFEKNTSVMVLSLEPREERIVNVTIYVFKGAKSENYSCTINHLTALTPKTEEEFKNITIRVPYIPYEKDVAELREALKKLKEEEKILIFSNIFTLALFLLFLFLWLKRSRKQLNKI